MNINISELQPVIDLRLITVDEEFVDSIKNYGVITPIITSNKVICDGHKRYKACQLLGIETVPFVEVKKDPVELYIELNNRDFDVNTVAILTKNLSDKEIAKLCKKVGFSDSPQMVNAIKVAGDILNKNPEYITYQLPPNIWRELGHLGEFMKNYAEDLLVMSGTVSEKRNIATYLRQAQRRNELPESIKSECIADITKKLQKTAQPRRTEAYEKYEKALSEISFPNGTNIKIDPTFTQPGILLTLPIKRSELNKLNEMKESLEELFKVVPEL